MRVPSYHNNRFLSQGANQISDRAFGVLRSLVVQYIGQGKLDIGYGSSFDRMPSISDWSQAAFCRLPVMPFISGVCSWRRTRSRVDRQEMHRFEKPKPQNSGCAIRKLCGAWDRNEQGQVQTGNREVCRCARCRWRPNAYSINVICKFFNPAAPASGDSKRRLSPSLRTGRPLADVKQNVRAFNRRRGHEVTTTAGHTEGVGQGKCAPSQTRHMDLELATLIAALRRRSSTEVNEAGVGRDLLLMGSMRSQSLSNKRDATNMHGDHERSQRCAIRTAAACQSWCVVLIYARTFGAITCRRLRQRLRTEAPDRISGGS